MYPLLVLVFVTSLHYILLLRCGLSECTLAIAPLVFEEYLSLQRNQSNMDYISRSGKSRSMIQYQGISRYTNGLSSSHVKTAQTGSQPPGGNRSNMPAIPVGMFVNTYPARCPNLPATSNSHFLDWYLNQDYIAAVPVPQHVDLAQWSSTKPSEYYGELHSDGMASPPSIQRLLI